MSAHWDAVYAARPPDAMSWFQREPVMSLSLLRAAAPPPAAVVDVGAGASMLVDHLLAHGWSDVTLVDLSKTALAETRTRLGAASGVSFVVGDVLSWQPEREYDAWHDRAVFHFLTEEADRARYVAQAAAALRPGGAAVIGAFAADGPAQCSGLPTARYSAAELAAVFAPAFALERAEAEEHVTPAGVVQPFTWVVLRR